jgi:hypothetical protein
LAERQAGGSSVPDEPGQGWAAAQPIIVVGSVGLVIVDIVSHDDLHHHRRQDLRHQPGGTTMKKIFIACVALSMSAAAFAAPAAQAPATAPAAPAAKTAQQNKMTTCNADAAGKKGDERKAFMKTCLSAPAAAAPMTQQQKMKSCNADATGKKGDERKAFMKSCLSAAH